MHTKSSLRLSFALLLLLVVETLADDDDTDFLMNVFYDLGPVLAFFGEQFARQFLSETFTWYDHVIFACVPLGNMRAIAGAIRVQGDKFLKAFIGRARENKAAAEIEYMSSTSAKVGELFNGRGIVRTMGQPEIAQFIVFPDELLKEKKGAQNQSYPQVRISRRHSIQAAVVPYCAQGYESQPWGLPCYIGGSVLLFIGKLACSVAIERSTKEFKWRPSSGINNETRDSSEVRPQSMGLFWVQRTQRVSDQDFDSYVISSRNKQFISTSSRREDVLSGKSNKENKGLK
ncbi:hypothetical protein J7337_012400 [Fusarium musae]|uniref:Uncharacterized protein n=1 Tax=Fusarium musae TaxID=1042133 RepID=A0A9P8D5P0_9HYPO|nr:hypothetical protein J7337_012400 [Fusarium musae]KAG9495842.1 hypothetical protein J7337_012400 [Fusarium musae]